MNIVSIKDRPLLGILGGMGMQATDYFCRMITNMQNVKSEQEYLDMLVYYRPSIPDRTDYILGKSKLNPLPFILKGVCDLEKAGVSTIVIPCVTSHYFYDQLQESTGIPILDIIKETTDYIADNGFNKVGLLATSGTIAGGFLVEALNVAGVEVVIPSDSDQVTLMDIIYSLKQNKVVRPAELDNHVKNLLFMGAEVIILGCTELSLLSDEHEYFADAVELLAKAALQICHCEEQSDEAIYKRILT